MSKIHKIELLAPAGNMEKLEIAIHYGADAVYLGGKDFSLRNFSDNFTLDETQAAIEFAHTNNTRVYVACNIYARNDEQGAISDYLKTLGRLAPDAVIISDPGIILEARRIIPQIPIHLSTQANTTNYKSALFWEQLGVRRIVVARELPLEEIRTVIEKTSLEIEAFVHGAMCISYSGRCLLSNFMVQRDSNRGMCSHPCRWKYALVEELRPGEYMPFAEDERGSYIFNSKDLCMIEHVPELIESGLHALKIEGRMKGINYLASTVRVYRDAIDSYYCNPSRYEIKKEWIQELSRINNRGYSTGFYFNEPDQVRPNYDKSNSFSEYRFVAKVIDTDQPPYVKVQVRNKIFRKDAVEIVPRAGPIRKDVISEIHDMEGQAVDYAQPGMVARILLSSGCSPNDLIRKVDISLQQKESCAP